MSGPAVRRYYVRYGKVRWERSRLYLGVVIVLLAGLVVYNLTQGAPVQLLVSVLLLEIFFFALFYVLRWTAYLELRPEAIHIRYLLARIELPYAAVARVRKQPLIIAFQPADRRRYVNAFVRRLGRDQAVYIRIDRRQEDLLAQLQRRLGPRMVAGPDVVLPIDDVEEFVTTVKTRLRSLS